MLPFGDVDQILELPPGFSLTQAWLPKEHADRLFDRLRTEIPWVQQPIRIFGQELMEPRMSHWQGSPNAVYRYSGRANHPAPLHPALESLRQGLEDELQCTFNSVLINLYRDERDSMGWHADDEAELGREPVIASISLGATRRFLVRPKQRARPSKPRRSIALDLDHGALLVMRGRSQADWEHALPKRRATAGPRINLTFRCVTPRP